MEFGRAPPRDFNDRQFNQLLSTTKARQIKQETGVKWLQLDKGAKNYQRSQKFLDAAREALAEWLREVLRDTDDRLFTDKVAYLKSRSWAVETLEEDE